MLCCCWFSPHNLTCAHRTSIAAIANINGHYWLLNVKLLNDGNWRFHISFFVIENFASLTFVRCSDDFCLFLSALFLYVWCIARRSFFSVRCEWPVFDCNHSFYYWQLGARACTVGTRVLCCYIHRNSRNKKEHKVCVFPSPIRTHVVDTPLWCTYSLIYSSREFDFFTEIPEEDDNDQQSSGKKKGGKKKSQPQTRKQYRFNVLLTSYEMVRIDR